MIKLVVILHDFLQRHKDLWTIFIFVYKQARTSTSILHKLVCLLSRLPQNGCFGHIILDENKREHNSCKHDGIYANGLKFDIIFIKGMIFHAFKSNLKKRLIVADVDLAYLAAGTCVVVRAIVDVALLATKEHDGPAWRSRGAARRRG